MKKVISVFASLVLAAWLLPAAFGQMSQQPQPQDPTTQQPSTSPQSTPPTQPQSEQKPQQPDPSASPAQTPSAQPAPQPQQPNDSSATSAGSSADAKTFMGTVVKAQDGYMLRAADLQYKLDDQERARQFDGKNVKVQGTLDTQSNTIHVQTIEASPQM